MEVRTSQETKAPVVSRASPYRRVAARVVTALVVIALIAGGYAYWQSRTSSTGPQFRTEPITIGNLVVTVSATGNLQPTNKVDVGSELSGTIESVFVDDNDRVTKGQVLARLDLTKLNAAVEKSRSALQSAEAKVLQTDATVQEARANLERLRQVRDLSGGKVPSQTEMATAEATFARSQADQGAARAAVSEARATLSSDETNVRKASIRSPINGVVLARKIDPGQTVAASLQAPVLFSLAEDLAEMELQVDVDEADVGQVRDGQKAMFRVDAYPAREYAALVSRVGFGSQVKDGVVSYPTLLKVDNDDLSLRPGMTATAEITTVTRDDILLIPNAALRFTPPAATQQAQSKGGIVGQLVPRIPRQPRKAGVVAAKTATQQIWIVKNGVPAPLQITVGPSNGRYTEVTGGDLKPGMEVITEALATASR